uniref:NADH-ubiquinone oxidoreductase chain 1 n=1 Tax=Modiolus philippinarum TaxID=310899 RepID=A0A1Z2WWX1_9BIVA|nr:NADH dehydrogenase subunit 1 [Modiolus philippinarum]ASB29980.1 NADH dehydrogenase subunit 1 [Modiolus philippinarum]
MQLLSLVIPSVCALMAVAWFTLLERKVLGYIMNRKGPNKVGVLGVIQPLADGVKLFSKELVVPTYSNIFPFILCPIVTLFVALLLWLLYPLGGGSWGFTCGFLLYLSISGVNVYCVLVAGWASNSKYALLGAMRGVAQSVSYEVSMAVTLLSVVFTVSVMDLKSIQVWQSGHFMVLALVFPSFMLLWLICMLAETNRAPFDFVEGESELVSGFNVEYSGGWFAMIYMAEYANMLFNSLFTCVMFLGVEDMLMSVEAMSFFLLFLWVRGSLPRFRYDMLMSLVWKSFLSLLLSSLLIVTLMLVVLA